MVDKKELKKQYKQTLPPMGVYQIKNLINNKIFIGSSKNLHAKKNSYEFQLQHGFSFMTKDFLDDYAKYGGTNFVFEVIDYLEPKEGISYDYTNDLKALEELWIEKLQPFTTKGYNEKLDKNTRVGKAN